MIPDWLTNHVYISGLLPMYYPNLSASLESILKRTGTGLAHIPKTKDIWCRDFMPGQVDVDTFCQFTYDPDYLRGYGHLITPDRSRTEVHRMLQDALQAECIIIPRPPHDPIGHAHGVVKFLDEDALVVNEYRGLEAAYGRRLRAVLRRHHLECAQVPYFVEDHATDGIPSAAGCYINYLRTDKLLILPVFAVARDDVAISSFESLFAGMRIVPLPCFELGT